MKKVKNPQVLVGRSINMSNCIVYMQQGYKMNNRQALGGGKVLALVEGTNTEGTEGIKLSYNFEIKK